MPSSAAQNLVDRGLTHHRAGRLDEAERTYRQVLEMDATHADATHLLGMIAFQTGRLDLAVDMIRKAIAVHPTAASYYSNLGNVLQAQDKLDEDARQSWQRSARAGRCGGRVSCVSTSHRTQAGHG